MYMVVKRVSVASSTGASYLAYSCDASEKKINIRRILKFGYSLLKNKCRAVWCMLRNVHMLVIHCP